MGKERELTVCPNLASILSHENLTLPYYSDSLPLKGNGSVVCRITESGNALDQCRGSLFWDPKGPDVCSEFRVKSQFLYSVKIKRSNETILHCLSSEEFHNNSSLRSLFLGNLTVKAAADSEGIGMERHLQQQLCWRSGEEIPYPQWGNENYAPVCWRPREVCHL